MYETLARKPSQKQSEMNEARNKATRKGERERKCRKKAGEKKEEKGGSTEFEIRSLAVVALCTLASETSRRRDDAFSSLVSKRVYRYVAAIAGALFYSLTK